jgi:intracellular sulfur oxidation DsrE/DsrF family protein
MTEKSDADPTTPRSRVPGAGLSRRGGLFAAVIPAALLLLTRRGAADSDNLEDSKPFAEHRLALQLSDEDPAKHRLVINVANNMLKTYTPDLIAIEVVTFGPGVGLLTADSPNREEVDSLVAQGVRFDVCMNTVHTLEHRSGQKLALNPNARPVAAGAAQLLTLAERKFTVLRP